jgi:hypothetical protein
VRIRAIDGEKAAADRRPIFFIWAMVARFKKVTKKKTARA